jgi:hypothetical protein
MSGKRRHHERQAKLAARELRARQEASAHGVVVDPAALAPHTSMMEPEFVRQGYYIDEPFVCESCGAPQTWTAAQQKWWYEVAKGPVFSKASRCRACRQRERALREEARHGGGDPNPYKNDGLLLARVRRDLEPELLIAGYQAVSEGRRGASRTPVLDYSRAGDLLSITWDRQRARLTAERLADGEADPTIIAAVEFSDARSTVDIDSRLVPFITSVRGFLLGLREPGPSSTTSGGPSAPEGISDA